MKMARAWEDSQELGRSAFYGHTPDCQEKRMFIQISPISDPKNSYIDRIENIGAVRDMLEECEYGDGYIIKCIEMSEAEYCELNEFVGF